MRLFVLASLAVGCACAQNVTVEFDPAADFSHYKTFSLREGTLNSKNPALNNELVKKRIDADIERYLSARGLTPASGQADLNVRYTLGSAKHTQTERYPAGWRGLGTRTVHTAVTEGTLVIDLRDTATRSLVWRGIAREDKHNAGEVQAKLDDMVKKSFEKYPPKAK